MRALGLRAEARVALGRARALAEELGADRPLCAEVLGDVSRLELGDGHAREALADAERAIAIEEATHTPGVAQPLASRGEALLGLHRPADAMARSSWPRRSTIRASSLGSSSSWCASVATSPISDTGKPRLPDTV